MGQYFSGNPLSFVKDSAKIFLCFQKSLKDFRDIPTNAVGFGIRYLPEHGILLIILPLGKTKTRNGSFSPWTYIDPTEAGFYYLQSRYYSHVTDRL